MSNDNPLIGINKIMKEVDALVGKEVEITGSFMHGEKGRLMNRRGSGVEIWIDKFKSSFKLSIYNVNRLRGV